MNSPSSMTIDSRKSTKRSSAAAAILATNHANEDSKQPRRRRLLSSTRIEGNETKVDNDQKSSWKLIQDQVFTKMEQHLKCGKTFPKSPPHPGLPKGVSKNHLNFQARIYYFLTMKVEYVGTWKKPEHAGQAFLYAKEALFHLKSSATAVATRSPILLQDIDPKHHSDR